MKIFTLVTVFGAGAVAYTHLPPGYPRTEFPTITNGVGLDSTIVVEPPPKTTTPTYTPHIFRFAHAKTSKPGTTTPTGTSTRTGTRPSISTRINIMEAVYGHSPKSIANPSSSTSEEKEDEDEEEQEEEEKGDNPNPISSINGTTADDSDFDPGENEIQAQHKHHNHHHLRHKPFFCTNVPRDEHWKTKMPTEYIPNWLPEIATLTGVLNTWVTATHLTHTSTIFWTDDKALQPPPEPTHKHKHKHGHHHHDDHYTLPTSLHDPYGPAGEGATSSPGGKGLGGGMNNGGGLEAHVVPLPTVTKFSTISTAFVTVTVTETITEAHSPSSSADS
ncbi:hypothetical protein F5Y03DRAFT_392345 [Xylaria venustula]|nr:hypothetical protein F5Y03DRAFT_392345 [Xylaria venustula]